MRYVSKCIPKQMRLQPLPENVGTERWVPEVVRQRVPGHRTGDGERPTAERAATMSWYGIRILSRRSYDKTSLRPKNSVLVLVLVLQVCCCLVKQDLVTLVIIMIL